MTTLAEVHVKNVETDEPSEEISPSTYKMILYEELSRLRQKYALLATLLEKLECAMSDRNLTLLFFETDETYLMVPIEKGQIGFLGKKAEYPAEPEGGIRISAREYREGLKSAMDSCEEKIRSIQDMFDRLDDALGDSELKVVCYQTDQGVDISITPKEGIFGFRPVS